jgi:tetratricopeptide (TPR) repeat protein
VVQLLGKAQYFIKGEREKSLDNYKQAERYLNGTLEINPRFSKADILLAKTYLALGNREKARMHAESALRDADSQDVVNEARAILQMK